MNQTLSHGLSEGKKNASDNFELHLEVELGNWKMM